jgi:WD40 repeat protein
MKKLTIARGTFQAVAYSDDGRSLFALHTGKHLRVWDLPSFEERLHLQGPWPFYCGEKAPPFALHWRRLILPGSMWDISGILSHLHGEAAEAEGLLRQVPLEGTTMHAVSLAFDLAGGAFGLPDGAVVGHTWSYDQMSYTVHLWSVYGRLMRSWPARGLTPPAFAVAPDGGLLAIRGEGATVALLALATGGVVARLEHTDDPRLARFSSDGRLLAVAAGRCVWLWDVATRLTGRQAPPFRLPAFRKHALALAFSPDGQLLAAAGGEGEVRLWDVATWRERARFDWQVGAVHGLAFAPDGMTLAGAGHDRAVVVWDVE